MTLIRWNPRRSMLSMNRDLEGLFDNMFLNDRWLNRERGWAPRVNVKELGDKFEVTAEIPGMKKEEISIELREDLLTIKGEKVLEKDENNGNYHISERSHGKFERTFTLPDFVEADKIEAEYKDGVLKVDIPKTEAPKPKEVKIKVK
jgi:HSP20 family protein